VSGRSGAGLAWTSGGSFSGVDSSQHSFTGESASKFLGNLSMHVSMRGSEGGMDSGRGLDSISPTSCGGLPSTSGTNIGKDVACAGGGLAFGGGGLSCGGEWSISGSGDWPGSVKGKGKLVACADDGLAFGGGGLISGGCGGGLMSGGALANPCGGSLTSGGGLTSGGPFAITGGFFARGTS